MCKYLYDSGIHCGPTVISAILTDASLAIRSSCRKQDLDSEDNNNYGLWSTWSDLNGLTATNMENII